MNELRLLDIDELRRNPEDGAYYCPKCDAPFTRRSNLRRHYGIHIRNENMKCNACRKIFTSSEELQYHVLQCPRSAWNAFEATSSLENHSVDSNCNKPELAGKTADFFPSATPSPPQHDDFDELFSSLTSTSMSTSPSLSPFPSLDSASLSGTPEWSLADLPTSKLLQKDTLEDPGKHMRPRSQRFNRSCHNVGIGRRLKSKEKPIYTRRQVEDMLDIVSKTFVARLEETLRRTGCINGEFWTHSNVGATVALPQVHSHPFL